LEHLHQVEGRIAQAQVVQRVLGKVHAERAAPGSPRCRGQAHFRCGPLPRSNLQPEVQASPDRKIFSRLHRIIAFAVKSLYKQTAAAV
jgi:hypothetical protein